MKAFLALSMTESIHSLPQAGVMGDPIPQVLLYGRKAIVFFMDNGGKGTPTAIAKYNHNIVTLP